nr:hypothetical protein [Actinomadura luzonensis]
MPYRTTTPSALAASSSSPPGTPSRIAAIADAPQIDTPAATSSEVPGDSPSARPTRGVTRNVTVVATATTASVGRPSASTSGTAICRPSRAIATRSTRRDTNASPGRRRAGIPARFASAAPHTTATTAGLSAGTNRLTTRAGTKATAVTATPGARACAGAVAVPRELSMIPVFAAVRAAGSRSLPWRS